MLSEFGGITFDDGFGHAGDWGYSSAADATDFAKRFDALLQTVIHTALFSGFCYTQFCDTFQEKNGLLRADRTPKIPMAAIAASTGMPRTHIAVCV